jgi:DNA modification methylase
MPTTEYITINVNEVKEDGDNPNKMSKTQLRALQKNIETYGNLVPIVIDQNNIIADGAQRLEVYKKMGLKAIPAIRITTTDIDRRIIRQVLNKLRGKHDEELDLEEFQRIIDADALSKLSELLGEKPSVFKLPEKKIKEDNFIIPATPKYNVKEGEVFQLGEHKLVCGDATKQKVLNKVLVEADCLVTDPPYNLAFNGTIHNQFEVMENDDSTQQDYAKFIHDSMTNINNFLKKNASLYVFIDFRSYHLWVTEILKNHELFNCIVWAKVFEGLGRKYRFRHEFIIYAGNKETKWYGNTTQEDFFKLTSTKKQSDVILDKKGFSYKLNKGYMRIKEEDTNPKRVPEVTGEIVIRTHNPEDTDVFENFSMNYFSQRELEHSEGIIHPTMKPINIIATIIQNSTRPQETVLDTFAGRGSTLIA